jgi:hypothetical protein
VTSFDYRVFGLNIRSDFELPELFPADCAEEPDIRIRRGPVTGSEAPGLQADGDVLVLTIHDVARYRIDGGREIVMDPEAGVPERNLRLFLLGSAFGALLHQRGLLPLHANAVEIEGRAIAFMGESGAGKSTLAAWFHDRAHRIVADDVCVVRFDAAGNALAQPGLPRLRLWDEALEATGRSAAEFARSYAGDETFNKFDVPIAAQTAADRELPLAAAYILERGERTEIQSLQGLEAVEAVFAHTYRGAFVAPADAAQSHWSAALQLVRSMPVFRFTRPWTLRGLDDSCSAVLRHAATVIGETLKSG